MKIAIDARWIYPEISGIGAYTVELIRQLAHLDRENEYLLFFERAELQERTVSQAGLGSSPLFRCEQLPFGIFSAAGQFRLGRILRARGVDVFHSPNYMIPLPAFPRGRPGRVRAVVTVHDLIPLLFPHYTPRALKTRLRPLFQAVMREVAARADVILTVSESSRRDILRRLRVPACREAAVQVAPNGVAAEFQPAPKTPNAVRTVLYVGRADPYKNLPGLVDAFARLRRLVPFEVRLRLIGPRDPRYPEAGRRAAELGIASDIEWSGYLAGADLVRAYQQADVFALPSFYEGFGLTVLEAMACGTPVVCGDRSSLPEVAGSAAVLVNPADPEAIAQALRRVLTDPELAATLRQQGLQRAAQFSWEQTARLTLAAYRYAFELGRGGT